jgi:hypothetical protein
MHRGVQNWRQRRRARRLRLRLSGKPVECSVAFWVVAVAVVVADDDDDDVMMMLALISCLLLLLSRSNNKGITDIQLLDLVEKILRIVKPSHTRDRGRIKNAGGI